MLRCFLRLWAGWFLQVDLHSKQGMRLSSIFKNDKEWMINKLMLFGLTALILTLALLWVELLSFVSCLFIPTICCCWFLWNFVSTVEPWHHYKMSMLIAWTCVSFPLLGLNLFFSPKFARIGSVSPWIKKKKPLGKQSADPPTVLLGLHENESFMHLHIISLLFPGYCTH